MDRSPAVKEAGRVGSLCDLSDELIHHILSFVPIKDVVRTGVLSRKWRNFWASAPTLAFHELQFPYRKCFFQLVERLLMFRDTSAINSFSLSCFVHQDAPSIYTWIYFAIKHEVQTLQLCLCQPSQPDIRFLVPSDVFRSHTLTELHLEIESTVVIPSTAFLPNLKVLSLVGVSFEDEQSIEKLLSSVPCLEDLTLQDIFCWHLKEINISARKLVRLYVVQKVFPANIRSNCRVVIGAPNLVFFCYTGGLFSEHAICGSSMLDQAFLTAHGPVEVISDQFASRGYLLLKGLSAAKYLVMTYNILEEFNLRKDFLDAFPVFPNLLGLTFDLDRVKLDSRALLALLSSSSRLISIIFDGGLAVESDEEGILEPTPQCFQLSLKAIKIGKFDATEEELLAISILLRAAKVLDELYINCSEDWSENFAGNLSQHVMGLPRSSDRCTILLH